MSVIQHIFRDHGDAYLERFGERMPNNHRKALRAIQECRSGARGHHLFSCSQCGEQHVAKSSCGNRHCPVCQHEKAIQWVYRQQLRLLPCTYFLATFTLPEGLRRTARSNQQAVYKALFDEAALSLRTLEADPRFVGCNVAGFFGLLHTWTRQLVYHPHVHFVIPGGGLSEDRKQWVNAHGQFLVHVKALSRMFRGKMKERLRQLGLFDSVPPEVWTQEWVVHCKAVGDGRHSLKYLGSYLFRVAISDARIVSYDGGQVTFKYQKGDSSKWRKVTLGVMEFIRRFLQHTLPTGFMKVRHYGFLSPNFGVSIQRIRELICMLYELLRDHLPPRPPERKRLRCGRCGAVMNWRCFLPVLSTAEGPPPPLSSSA